MKFIMSLCDCPYFSFTFVPQVKSVVHLLLGNLDTPSQQVQEAIAACLPPLASVVKADAEDIIKKLVNKVRINAVCFFF